MTFAGKTAIVTGAGQGLGRAIARVLAERGASVVLTGRTLSKLESAQNEIRSMGGQVEISQGDVGSRSDIGRMVDVALRAFGGIDILINNAQSLSYGVSVLDVTDENLEPTFRSGLFGTLYAMQACYPHLKARGGGSIVNFGSVVALDGRPGFAAYAVTKEAIRGLSRAAAREWGPDGIRVNVICPATRDPNTFPQRLQSGDPLTLPALRRPGDPLLDIGRAVASLVSDDLSYLTGATLMLDGGGRIID